MFGPIRGGPENRMLRPAAVVSTKLSLLLCAALVLGGCNAIRYATGQIKAPLDEFAIRTFAPLVMPLDGSLRLPQPGMRARTDLAASERGRSILFAQTTNTATALAAETYSDGEAFLLRKANIEIPSPEV